MIINVNDHPNIASALELLPGAKYLITLSAGTPMHSAEEFNRLLREHNIDAVVVILDGDLQVKVFNLS